MTRAYNFIYKQLVEGQNDIVGHIAYSLYKAEKVEFIESFKKDHGNNEPTEQDLEPFHRATSLKSSIERYRFIASNILGETLNNVLQESIQDIEKRCQENHKQMLSEAVSPLKPNPYKQFLSGSAQSVVGAFVFSFLLAIMGFINLFKLSDIIVSYKENNNTPEQTETVPYPTLPQDTISVPYISKPDK